MRAQLLLLAFLLLTATAPITTHASPHHVGQEAKPTTLIPFKDAIPRVPRLTGIQQPLSSSAPTGLASYGDSTPLQTSAVMGSLTVTKEGIGPDIFPNFTLLTEGLATLQLNAVLWIPGHGEYWTQNVLFIYGPNNTYAQVEAINNVWNFSSPTVDPMNPQYVQGNGTAVQFNKNLGYYYYVDPAIYNLTLPYTVNLSMTLTQTKNGAATVQFTYTITSGRNQYTKTYDEVTLYPKAPPTQAYYKIGGYTPIGLPSDLEYVLGGPGGGTYAYYLNLTATISLYYKGGTAYRSVPEAYSAGSDTAEEVFDVYATRDFQNYNTPQATLNANLIYTYESTYQLWPTPTTLALVTQPNYQQGTLTIKGQLTYPATSSGAPIQPATNTTLTLEVDGQTVATTTTNNKGEYTLTWTPHNTGYYNLLVATEGTTALTPAAQTLTVGVTSIKAITKGSLTAQLELNNTPIYLAGNTTLYIPVELGQTIVVSAPQYYYPGPNTSIRLESLGFNTTHTTSITLTPTNYTSTAAIFQTQYYVEVQDEFGSLRSGWYNTSQHITLNTPQIEQVTPQERWLLQNWSVDGQTYQNGATLTVNRPLTIEANYVMQYYVNITDEYTAGLQGWFDKDSQINLSTPQTAGTTLLPLIFKGWSGTITNTNTHLTLKVYSPINEIAQYTPQYTYITILFIILVAVGFAAGRLLSWARIRKPTSQTQPT